MSPAKLAEPVKILWSVESPGPKVGVEAQTPEGKGQFWEGHFSAHCEVWGVSQSYSVGGGSSAALHCQY